MTDLLREAKRLGEKVNTDYAEEHPEEWEAFDDCIQIAYDRGDITAAEFNELATTAFYDYFNLKGEEQ